MYCPCKCFQEDCSSSDSLENCCITAPPCCCKPIVKGKFGLAYIIQTPKTKCCQPLGWEVEFEDTPSKINNNCQKMVKWINCPPLGGCQNIETHFCEYPRQCGDLLKKTKTPCSYQTYREDPVPPNSDCKCCYHPTKRTRNKCCKCSKDTRRSFCCAAENKCRCESAENLCCCYHKNRQQSSESRKMDCRCKKKVETNCKCEDDTLDYVPKRDITVINTTKTVKDSHTQSRSKPSRRNEKYINTHNKSKQPNHMAEKEAIDNNKTNGNEQSSNNNSPVLEDSDFKTVTNSDDKQHLLGSSEKPPSIETPKTNDGKQISEKEIVNVIYDRTSESIPQSSDNVQKFAENLETNQFKALLDSSSANVVRHPSVYENLTPLQKIRKARERQKDAIENSKNESIKSNNEEIQKPVEQ